MYRSLAAGVLAAFVAVVVLEQGAAAVGWAKEPAQAQFEHTVRLVRSRAANENVFVMSYHLGSAYPLINYSGARSGSTFPHLWILAAEYLEALKREEPLRYRHPDEMSLSERYLNRRVLEDLRQRPKLLLVFRAARDLPTNGYRRLDYIAYFSRDSVMAEILTEYELIAQTGDYLVYQWVRPGAPRTGPPPVVTPPRNDIMQAGASGLRLRLGDPRLLIAFMTFLAGAAAALLSSCGRAGLRPGRQGPAAAPLGGPGELPASTD
jgi:hypothetical protein